MIDATRSGDFIISCDSCDDDERVGGDTDFAKAVEHAKTLGWTVRKVSEGYYEHFCPACSKPDFGRVSQ